MSAPPATAHGLWLLPQQTDAERYNLVIDELARRYGGIRFQAHLTLLPVLHRPIEKVPQWLAAIAANHAAVDALPTAFAADPHYFRFLSVSIASNLALSQLRRAVSAGEPTDNNPFSPHISLLYRAPQAALQRTLCERLPPRHQPLLAPCLLDRLALVELGADISQWRLLDTFALKQRQPRASTGAFDN